MFDLFGYFRCTDISGETKFVTAADVLLALTTHLGLSFYIDEDGVLQIVPLEDNDEPTK